MALELPAEDVAGKPQLGRVLARLDARRVLADIDDPALAVEELAAFLAEARVVGDVSLGREGPLVVAARKQHGAIFGRGQAVLVQLTLQELE